MKKSKFVLLDGPLPFAFLNDAVLTPTKAFFYRLVDVLWTPPKSLFDRRYDVLSTSVPIEPSTELFDPELNRVTGRPRDSDRTGTGSTEPVLWSCF